MYVRRSSNQVRLNRTDLTYLECAFVVEKNLILHYILQVGDANVTKLSIEDE